MKRQEIKERLKDIIANTEKVTQSLKEKQDWFNELKMKLDDLDRHVKEQGADLFDWGDVLQEITIAFFEQELEEVAIQVEDLNFEIESYADRLSEARADEIYVRYEDLDEVLLQMDPSDYEGIEYAIGCLQKAVELLQKMYDGS